MRTHTHAHTHKCTNTHTFPHTLSFSLFLSQAEEEELDIIDEALFLMRTEDDDVSIARSSQQEADQGLLENYLEGVLPGGCTRVLLLSVLFLVRLMHEVRVYCCYLLARLYVSCFFVCLTRHACSVRYLSVSCLRCACFAVVFSLSCTSMDLMDIVRYSFSYLFVCIVR